MRRILITEESRGWGFECDGKTIVAATPLMAAVEARAFGDTLRGKAAGYVVRLDTGQGIITLHSRVFDNAAGEGDPVPALGMGRACSET